MGGILNAIQISSNGLSVQRAKMNTVAKNMANVETTETEKGGPYQRQRVVVSEDKVNDSFGTVLHKARSRLVRTNSNHLSGKTPSLSTKSDIPSVDQKVIIDKESSYKLVHDPNHPHADEEGFVRMPDVDIVTEMVDMIAASRAYEANTVAISSAKEMAEDALDI